MSNEEHDAAQSGSLPRFVRGLDFSGTTAEGAPWSDDWLSFTDSEYYHRVRRIMLDYGMGEGDVEMILANVWENGWIRGNRQE